MISIAEKVRKITGVEIKIYGFDTGKGMPKPVDYRDHPDLYNVGDFPMNQELLIKTINGRAEILFGEVGERMDDFKKLISVNCPVGFVSVDVDYYSSAVDALKVFDFPPEYYLPLTYVYFDDTSLLYHNSICGELLAIREYNDRNKLRIIEHHEFFVKYRIFKNAIWLNQIYFLHVLDHPRRHSIDSAGGPRVIENAYLSYEGNKEKFDRKRK